jgi:hypothetical protein
LIEGAEGQLAVAEFIFLRKIAYPSLRAWSRRAALPARLTSKKLQGAGRLLWLLARGEAATAK